jgi:hypothetical protein
MIRWQDKSRGIPDLSDPGTAHYVSEWACAIAYDLEREGLPWNPELYVPPPPYVTVADCGHCFEDAGERT